MSLLYSKKKKEKENNLCKIKNKFFEKENKSIRKVYLNEIQKRFIIAKPSNIMQKNLISANKPEDLNGEIPAEIPLFFIKLICRGYSLNLLLADHIFDENTNKENFFNKNVTLSLLTKQRTIFLTLFSQKHCK